MHDPLALAFSAADLSRVVGSCPNLQQLTCELHPGVQLAALSQLTALTTLSISKATESSVNSLSGLVELQDLTVTAHSACSLAALVPLTALRQLTSLDISPMQGVGGAGGVRVYHKMKVRCLNATVVELAQRGCGYAQSRVAKKNKGFTISLVAGAACMCCHHFSHHNSVVNSLWPFLQCAKGQN